MRIARIKPPRDSKAKYGTEGKIRDRVLEQKIPANSPKTPHLGPMPRMGRMKMEWGTEYHHCISRVVNRAFVFGPEEREKFIGLMRKYEEFTGIKVLTFCILSNHFHLLCEVPKRPETLPDDEELLRRLARISSRAAVTETRQLFKSLREEGNEQMLAQMRERLLGRMWDISTFMQQLKQRFTQWFNRKHNRVGTLWEERFKSVLVEGAGCALATMAAYIDLNPVRAGLVKDPEDYRWSGYGRAVAGDKLAVAGLGVIAHYFGMTQCSKREVLKRYRVWVYEEGVEVKPDWMSQQKGRRGIASEKVDEVVKAGGELRRGELLKVRVRYFLDGAVLGSREFVEDFIARRKASTGWKRKTGGTRMKGGDWGGLHTLRALREKVFG